MEEKFWNKSISAWSQLYTMDNTNANINYKLGYCYLQTANSKEKALEYLKNAAAFPTSKKYDPYNPGERRAPVDAIYYLGLAYHLNYDLDMAVGAYNDFLKLVPKNHILAIKARHGIEQCENAKKEMANPRSYVITNVGPVINDTTNDFSPVLSIDESAMFFTSRRLRKDTTNSGITDLDTGEWMEDVYVSYKDRDGNWMEPELLNLNSNEHDATISISPDGQTLFIYRDTTQGRKAADGRIFESRLVGETWSDPLLLGSDINTPNWETHATISSDGQTLYFVSDRAGGFGGRDIFKCVKLPNGEWSRALNIGAGINTPWEEDSPFLTPDGQTLYFASSGHNSMGGFDIFYSTLGADGEWSTPINMGYPLNTVDDDAFFVPMADGRRAYYSSSKAGGFGLKDIYLVELPEVTNESSLAVLKGFIIGEEGKPLPDDIRILITNTKTGEVTEYRPRQRDGGYVAILQPCTGYKLEYIQGKTIFHEDYINVPCESSYKEIEKEVYLMPVGIAPDKPIVIIEPEKPKEEPKEPEKPKEFEYDPNAPVNISITDAQAHFSRYFIYDEGEYSVAEDKFAEFITGVDKIIKLRGKAIILVESSASNVPSSRFKNNEELTAHRNKVARDQVKQELSKLGYKEGVNYEFSEPRKLVQGKKYENDAKKNVRLYEQWQYIKIWAE
ncbi:MAG: PD40 domain-containing protein [Flavobacteriales bacterium]|nr:PD40 domain-containing protein [Flavobacteriales bacterium]